MRVGVLVLLWFGLVAAPIACASDSSEDGVDALRKRAEAYWQARIAESDSVKEFYLPNADGAPIPEGLAFKLGGASIEDIEVNDDQGRVDTEIEIKKFQFAMSARMSQALASSDLVRKRTLRQKWVRVDGVWYRTRGKPFGGALDKLQAQTAPRRIDAGAGTGSDARATSDRSTVRNEKN